MQYLVERGPERDALTFHVDKRIVGGVLPRHKPTSDTERKEGDEWKEEKLPRFVKDLFSVDGVTKIDFEAYSVTVTKGKLFGWDDVARGILHWLHMHLDPEGQAQAVEISGRQRSPSLYGSEITVGCSGNEQSPPGFGKGVWEK